MSAQRSFKTLKEVLRPYKLETFYVRLILAARSEHELRVLLSDARLVPDNCRLLARHERLCEEAWAELFPHGHGARIIETELHSAITAAREGRTLTRYYRDTLHAERSEEKVDASTLPTPLVVKRWFQQAQTLGVKMFGHWFTLQCYYVAAEAKLIVDLATPVRLLTEPLTVQLLTLPPSLQWQDGKTNLRIICHGVHSLAMPQSLTAHLSSPTEARGSFLHALRAHLRANKFPVDVLSLRLR